MTDGISNDPGDTHTLNSVTTNAYRPPLKGKCPTCGKCKDCGSPAPQPLPYQVYPYPYWPNTSRPYYGTVTTLC